MTIDFQKIQDEVSQTRQLVQALYERLNQPALASSLTEEDPLTVQQAADLLDVTTATVYDLVHKRRIPNHRPGKRLYFLRSELIDWIKNGRRSTIDELALDAATRPTRQTQHRGDKAV